MIQPFNPEKIKAVQIIAKVNVLEILVARIVKAGSSSCRSKSSNEIYTQEATFNHNPTKSQN